jgi:hypothetical protein
MTTKPPTPLEFAQQVADKFANVPDIADGGNPFVDYRKAAAKRLLLDALIEIESGSLLGQWLTCWRRTATAMVPINWTERHADTIDCALMDMADIFQEMRDEADLTVKHIREEE